MSASHGARIGKMHETVKLEFDGKTYELPVVMGSEGERAIDIGKLRELSGLITLDPGYKNTGSCRSEISSSTARGASCAIAGIPSRSS